MTSPRITARWIGILAATVGGVAAVAFGLAAVIVPPSTIGERTPTPEPSLDVRVAPGAIGGRLEVEGDRSGTMALDRGSYVEVQDTVVVAGTTGDFVLQGADGRIRFERSTGGVTLIDYDGLSFYPDPGECSVTPGAVDGESGLMAALVECPEIDDIRGQATVGLTGVVALPADVLRGRGSDVPPSGGRVDVNGTLLTFRSTVISLRAPRLGESGLMPAIHSEDASSGIHLAYDEQTDRYFLGAVILDGDTVVLSEPCLIAAEELGRMNELGMIIRLEIDCVDAAVPGGGTGSVSGTLVADVIE